MLSHNNISAPLEFGRFKVLIRFTLLALAKKMELSDKNQDVAAVTSLVINDIIKKIEGMAVNDD
jgi:curli biogenesis system outer membrane secretion channel CsgG